jgi:predicted phosphoadenosine phosphosulfate sulfurtransferase
MASPLYDWLFKQVISQKFKRNSMKPRELANLWHLAHVRDRATFCEWFERMTDKHVHHLHAYSEDDWATFRNRVAEITNGTTVSQNA